MAKISGDHIDHFCWSGYSSRLSFATFYSGELLTASQAWSSELHGAVSENSCNASGRTKTLCWSWWCRNSNLFILDVDGIIFMAGSNLANIFLKNQGSVHTLAILTQRDISILRSFKLDHFENIFIYHCQKIWASLTSKILLRQKSITF